MQCPFLTHSAVGCCAKNRLQLGMQWISNKLQNFIFGHRAIISNTLQLINTLEIEILKWYAIFLSPAECWQLARNQTIVHCTLLNISSTVTYHKVSNLTSIHSKGMKHRLGTVTYPACGSCGTHTVNTIENS